MKSLLFIHRSVGRNIIADGNLRSLLENHIEFNDYDQNYDTLNSSDGNKMQCRFHFPEGDTKPKSYAKIFSLDAAMGEVAIRDFALKYDAVAIKSCYPNSNIKSEEEYNEVKKNYISIANFFNHYPSKQLIILTSPPLAPIMTNLKNAERARSISEWLETTDLGKNVNVFNLFNLLADSKSGRLRQDYRRLMPFDSHPNTKASAEIALLFSDFIVDKLS